MHIDTDQAKLDVSQSMPGEDANVEATTVASVIPGLQYVEPRNSTALTVLCVLAVAYSLHFAADILLPIVLGIYLNLLLRPAVQRLQRAGIAPAVSALVLIALVPLAGGLMAEAEKFSSAWPALASRTRASARACFGYCFMIKPSLLIT